eukprot:832000-Ditylum_brightwellii.AAC.1
MKEKEKEMKTKDKKKLKISNDFKIALSTMLSDNDYKTLVEQFLKIDGGENIQYGWSRLRRSHHGNALLCMHLHG